MEEITGMRNKQAYPLNLIKKLNLLPIQLITKFDCYFSIMFFLFGLQWKVHYLLRTTTWILKTTCLNCSHFQIWNTEAVFFNILLINFNFILELFNYLEKHRWEMCKHRLQQFKTEGSRHFCHANQPIWLISIYQLHQVLEIIFMLFYTYMWFIIKTKTESFSSQND